MLDGSLLHSFLGFGVSGLSGSAHFLFEVGDGTQRYRHLANRFADFLDATFADVRAAAKVAQGRAQPWTNGVTTEFLGDLLAIDVAAASTGACVPLVLGDDGRRFGKFGILVPGGLGIVGSGFFRQRRFTVFAEEGHKGNRMLDTFGWQAKALMAFMSRLAAAFAAGGFLGGWLGGVRRVGGGWNRGVGRNDPE